eukprot:25461_1
MTLYSVLVTNIATALSEQHVQELFSCCGEILHTEFSSGSDASTCVITFDSEDGRKAALLLAGTVLGDRGLTISETSPPASFVAENESTANNAALPPDLPPAVQPAPVTHQNFPPVTPASLASYSVGLNSNFGISQLEATSQFMQKMKGTEGTAGMGVLMATQKRVEDILTVARTIYVGNLDTRVTEDQLRKFFTKCGTVLYIKMSGNQLQGARYCFIEFATQQEAQVAMCIHGKDALLFDKTLKIGPAQNPISKPANAAARTDPSKLEKAMRRVREAQERLKRRKETETKRQRSGSDSRDRSESPARKWRKRSSRRRKSPERRSHRRHRPRTPERHVPMHVAEKAKTKAGMIWDGFRWIARVESGHLRAGHL